MNQPVSSYRQVETGQADWARERTLDPNRSRYLAAVSDNIYLGELHPATEAEFRSGDGAELVDAGLKPAKMRALMSSSALAVNYFDAWRETDKAQLAMALGLPAGLDTLCFEFRPTGYPVKPRSPNLDLLLTLSNGDRVAVESKFTEPYRGSKRPVLSRKYFPTGRQLWKDVDLPACQQLSDTLSSEWHSLDVAQLLKHMLGLACDPHGAKTLLYLWYDTGLADADAHRAELSRFADLVSGDRVGLMTQTYQAAYRALRGSSAPHPKWHDYMRERYFQS
jgi:hypothetical protein